MQFLKVTPNSGITRLGWGWGGKPLLVQGSAARCIIAPSKPPFGSFCPAFGPVTMCFCCGLGCCGLLGRAQRLGLTIA